MYKMNSGRYTYGQTQLVVTMVSLCLKRVCVWAAFDLPMKSFFPCSWFFFSIEQRFQRKADSVDVMLILYKVSCIFYLLRDHYDSKRINQSRGYAETSLVGGFLFVYLWRRRIFFFIVPKKKMIFIQVLHVKKCLLLNYFLHCLFVLLVLIIIAIKTHQFLLW